MGMKWDEVVLRLQMMGLYAKMCFYEMNAELSPAIEVPQPPTATPQPQPPLSFE
jgi:hypothetical protein